MGIQDIGDNVRRHMKIRRLTIPQLSAKIGMGTASLSNLLNGKAEPRSSTLIKLAEGLDVPFDELLADAPRLNSVRFRTAKILSGREKAERDQIRHDTAIWLSDYCFLEKELKAARPYVLDQIADRDPSSAAMVARDVFKLNPTDPIHDISELMEQAGIKLRIRPFGFKKTFGLSIGDEDGGPGIVVNSEEGISVERQLFTIAHELGHLILHKSSYKNPDEVENEVEEHEADLFAGTFLVPAEALEKEWNESKGLVFVDRVLKIKKIFKVSYKTLLIRLVQLDPSLSLKPLIIRFCQDYKAKYHHDLKDYYEPDSLSPDESNPVATYDPQELDISDLMEDRFSRLVRDAYEKEIISMSRAGEMLNLSITDMRTLILAWQAL
jgi:Zn-dependent peptidase ImmA (M78 family)/DNA-binding Xre family transcriptional regulator